MPGKRATQALEGVAIGVALGELLGFFISKYVWHDGFEESVFIHLVMLVFAVLFAIVWILLKTEEPSKLKGMRRYTALGKCLTKADEIRLKHRLSRADYKRLRNRCLDDYGF
jgi:high-affinity Fe2+/Pb2+ permease